MGIILWFNHHAAYDDCACKESMNSFCQGLDDIDHQKLYKKLLKVHPFYHAIPQFVVAMVGQPQGGFTVRFVKKPPKEIKSECPVCHQDPYQVT